jgi:hypothetical protein
MTTPINRTTKCNICQMDFENPYRLLQHRKQAHPESFRKRLKHASTIKSPSAIDLMLEGRQKIIEALKLVDAELGVLHNRTIELSDLAAKYKKLI